ncbi:MAG: ParB/RepB/Spo0J family partition protein [Gammaproteobacteria bacterium]
MKIIELFDQPVHMKVTLETRQGKVKSVVEGEIQRINPMRMRPGPFSVRQNRCQEACLQLVQSISAVGMKRPVIIRSVSPKPGYEILDGERRWRAALQLGLPAIPALVKRPESQRQAIVASLFDNIRKETLDVFEEADGYKLLMDAGLDQQAIAQALCVAEDRVIFVLALQHLDAKSRAALRERDQLGKPPSGKSPTSVASLNG